MSSIEPFGYQKRTNIEEHNQIVDKLNEVIDVVNNANPEPSEFEKRIDALELSAINQRNTIDGIIADDLNRDAIIKNVADKQTETDTTVAGLTGQVGQLDTEVTNVEGSVTSLNNRLTVLAENHAALDTKVTGIDTEVGQISTEVGGLETGKVDVAQGTENAGKFLKVGNDGNVELGDVNIPTVPTYYLSASSVIYNAGSAKPASTVVRNGIEGYVFNASYSAGTPLLVGKIVNTVTLAGVVYEIDPVSGSFTNKLQDIGGMMNYDVGTNGILTVNVWIPADEIDGRSIESITIGLDFIKIEVKSR